MSKNDADGFFDDAQKTGAPGFYFGKTPGPHVVGTIVDMYKTDFVPFGKKEPKIDERTGEVVKQLVIVLETDLRNWDGVNPDSDSMKSEDGTPKDPKLDTGLRALYAVPGTNLYSAIGRAIKDDETSPSRNPQIGAKLMVQFHEDEDTGKGNPLKKFRAKYKAPAETVDAGFEPDKPAAKPESEAKSATVVDEPPF